MGIYIPKEEARIQFSNQIINQANDKINLSPYKSSRRGPDDLQNHIFKEKLK